MGSDICFNDDGVCLSANATELFVSPTEAPTLSPTKPVPPPPTPAPKEDKKKSDKKDKKKSDKKDKKPKDKSEKKFTNSPTDPPTMKPTMSMAPTKFRPLLTITIVIVLSPSNLNIASVTSEVLVAVSAWLLTYNPDTGLTVAKPGRRTLRRGRNHEHSLRGGGITTPTTQLNENENENEYEYDDNDEDYDYDDEEEEEEDTMEEHPVKVSNGDDTKYSQTSRALKSAFSDLFVTTVFCERVAPGNIQDTNSCQITIQLQNQEFFPAKGAVGGENQKILDEETEYLRFGLPQQLSALLGYPIEYDKKGSTTLPKGPDFTLVPTLSPMPSERPSVSLQPTLTPRPTQMPTLKPVSTCLPTDRKINQFCNATAGVVCCEDVSEDNQKLICRANICQYRQLTTANPTNKPTKAPTLAPTLSTSPSSAPSTTPADGSSCAACDRSILNCEPKFDAAGNQIHFCCFDPPCKGSSCDLCDPNDSCELLGFDFCCDEPPCDVTSNEIQPDGNTTTSTSDDGTPDDNNSIDTSTPSDSPTTTTGVDEATSSSPTTDIPITVATSSEPSATALSEEPASSAPTSTDAP